MIGHKDYDVDPWSDFGIGNGDNTRYDIRCKDTTSKILFGEFNFWSDKYKAIEKFRKIDKEKSK